MVFYVTKSGDIVHSSQAYFYKNEYWTKEELATEAAKDTLTLKNWGF